MWFERKPEPPVDIYKASSDEALCGCSHRGFIKFLRILSCALYNLKLKEDMACLWSVDLCHRPGQMKMLLRVCVCRSHSHESAESILAHQRMPGWRRATRWEHSEAVWRPHAAEELCQQSDTPAGCGPHLSGYTAQVRAADLVILRDLLWRSSFVLLSLISHRLLNSCHVEFSVLQGYLAVFLICMFLQPSSTSLSVSKPPPFLKKNAFFLFPAPPWILKHAYFFLALFLLEMPALSRLVRVHTVLFLFVLKHFWFVEECVSTAYNSVTFRVLMRGITITVVLVDLIAPQRKPLCWQLPWSRLGS